MIARDSGNRYNESPWRLFCRLEAQHGDPLAALDYITLAIRNYHNSGNTAVIRVPLALLATFLDRLGRDEPAATIAGYVSIPSPRRCSLSSTPRSPNYVMSWATRPMNRSPARVRR